LMECQHLAHPSPRLPLHGHRLNLLWVTQTWYTFQGTCTQYTTSKLVWATIIFWYTKYSAVIRCRRKVRKWHHATGTYLHACRNKASFAGSLLRFSDTLDTNLKLSFLEWLRWGRFLDSHKRSFFITHHRLYLRI
jgi:hypothetical protein